MSVDQILGYAKSFLDLMGLTNFLIAFVIISLATSTYFRFFGD